MIADIKKDLLTYFCPKDQMKDIENKLFAMEEILSRGPSKVQLDLKETMEKAIEEV